VYSGRISSSNSTSGIPRDTLVINTMVSHKWGDDYDDYDKWNTFLSFVAHIF